MGTGSRSQQVVAREPLPWWRIALTWMLIVVAETAHGAIREWFIAPVIGALRARQLGVLIGSVIVLFIAWACSRWLNLATRRAQLAAGACWVTLTLIFELSLGRAMGWSWTQILSDYNPAQGGFMLLGLAVMWAAPMLTRRTR
jgi:hypothetical protein